MRKPSNHNRPITAEERHLILRLITKMPGWKHQAAKMLHRTPEAVERISYRMREEGLLPPVWRLRQIQRLHGHGFHHLWESVPWDPECAARATRLLTAGFPISVVAPTVLRSEQEVLRWWTEKQVFGPKGAYRPEPEVSGGLEGASKVIHDAKPQSLGNRKSIFDLIAEGHSEALIAEVADITVEELRSTVMQVLGRGTTVTRFEPESGTLWVTLKLRGK